MYRRALSRCACPPRPQDSQKQLELDHQRAIQKLMFALEEKEALLARLTLQVKPLAVLAARAPSPTATPIARSGS